VKGGEEVFKDPVTQSGCNRRWWKKDFTKGCREGGKKTFIKAEGVWRKKRWRKNRMWPITRKKTAPDGQRARGWQAGEKLEGGLQTNPQTKTVVVRHSPTRTCTKNWAKHREEADDRKDKPRNQPRRPFS